MKKVLYFVMICLWAFGTIGGFGYACYNGAYPIAAGCVACGYMSWNTVRNYANKLML